MHLTKEKTIQISLYQTNFPENKNKHLNMNRFSKMIIYTHSNEDNTETHTQLPKGQYIDTRK